MASVEIIYLTLDIVIVIMIIVAIIMKRRAKATIDGIIAQSVSDRNRIDEFIEGANEEIDKYVAAHNERLNLLSRENTKLRNEKEMLKDKLRNLGVTNFDGL